MATLEERMLALGTEVQNLGHFVNRNRLREDEEFKEIQAGLEVLSNLSNLYASSYHPQRALAQMAVSDQITKVSGLIDAFMTKHVIEQGQEH